MARFAIVRTRIKRPIRRASFILWTVTFGLRPSPVLKTRGLAALAGLELPHLGRLVGDTIRATQTCQKSQVLVPMCRDGRSGGASMPRTVPGLKAILIAAAVLLSLAGCRSVHADGQPSIEFSRIPEAGDGSPVKVEAIEGRVKGARPGERIVVFALSGVWWVQPLADQPFTAIQPDSTWKTSTHPGSAYAALLVDSRYHPPLRINALPEKGGPVLAIATVAGALPRVPLKTIQFSGYQWEVRENSYDAGGTRNYFDRRNAWTDSQGLLHLRIARQGQRWTSAEVKLTRSLGYGSYRFVVRDVAHLEPGAVCAIFTWDDLGPSREMEIEISRWGEPEDQNGQYVIQPYVVPANT